MNEGHELWSGLNEAQRDEVKALAVPLSLRRGKVLFRTGADADNLYLIEHGLIVLSMPTKIGGRWEDVLIDERSRDQTLGWSALIPPHRFTLDARAPVSTDLLAFGRQPLLAYFAARPEVGYLLVRNVAAVVGQRLHVYQTMWLRQVRQLANVAHG